jgi:type I restriction enzyme R subunit
LRSLTGLDREAAARAFGRFQAGRTLTANQLHFVNMLIDVLARRGLVDVGQLYDPPFTQLTPSGPERFFTESDIDTVESVLHQVRSTAIPESQAV